MAITKVTTDGIDMSGNTGGLTWVKGTTAQRTTTTLGDLRANTETNRVEIYTDQTGTSEWRNLKEEGVSTLIDFLVVAGGGGTGQNRGTGGGGAGGLRTSFGSSSTDSKFSVSLNTSYTIEIGAGGAATSSTTGGTGGDSQFATITSAGGGGGGVGYTAPAVNGGNGGSGGGAGSAAGSLGTAGTATPAGQGNDGGAANSNTNNEGAGGGGGAGAVGGAGGINIGGAGGAGVIVNILPSTDAGTGNAEVGEVVGTDVYYAGGGGGGYNNNTDGSGTQGAGGIGGGGNGGGGKLAVATYTATDGDNNTGGGAGGPGGNTISPAKAGGSGVVILRYPSTLTLNIVSGTLTQPTGSPFTDGSDLVSVFKSNSGVINFT